MAHSGTVVGQPTAGKIKKVIGGVTPNEAIDAFAELWVSDEHWEAADRVMNRAK